MEQLKKYVRDIISIPENELNNFCKYFQLKQVKRKELILKQGEFCKFEAFIVSGCFRVFYLNKEGKEYTLYFGIKDWWVTDLDSLLNHVPAQFSIEAIEDSTILVISQEDKEKAYREIEGVERLFRIIFQRSLILFKERIIQSNSNTATERYDYFTKTFPTIVHKLSNIQLASYIGVSAEFISKIRKKSLY